MAHFLSQALSAALLFVYTYASNAPGDHVMRPENEQCGRGNYGGPEFQIRGMCAVPKTQNITSEPTSWSPWTHKPYCNEAQFCVFTNAMFRGKQGVSFVTTSGRIPLNMADILSYGPTREEPSPPPYSIRPVLGKGFGVVAIKSIRKDEIIMVDAARLIADADIPSIMGNNNSATLFTQAMEQLPDPSLLSTLATSSNDGESPLTIDIFKTNSYALELDEIARMALFPKVARINHACDPNAMMTVSRKTMETVVTAVRDITVGEEINVSYIELGETWSDRQGSLNAQWGFKCECSLCSATPEHRKKSDQRRERIKGLQTLAQEQIQDKNYEKALKSYQEIIKLASKERLFSRLGDYYWVMAYLYSALADRRNTIKYLRMARTELSKFRESRPDLDKILEDLDSSLAAAE